MLYILDYIIGYHGFIIENPWFQICFFHIFSIGFMAMMCCADIELIDVFFARPSWVPVRSLHASWIPEMAQTHTTTGETWWNCHAAIMYFENQKFGRLEPHFRHETLPLWISLIAHVLMVINIQSAYWMPWAIPYVWWPINYHLGIVWKWSLHNTYIYNMNQQCWIEPTIIYQSLYNFMRTWTYDQNGPLSVDGWNPKLTVLDMTWICFKL